MSTWTILTVAGPGKKRVLVRLDAATAVYEDGQKSRICFDQARDWATALRVDEGLECIARSLGGMVVKCVAPDA